MRSLQPSSPGEFVPVQGCSVKPQDLVQKCHFRSAGLLSENVASSLDGTALMLSAGASSVAAGVPMMVMPAPLVAAGGLAMYLESAALRDYLLFVAGTLSTGWKYIIGGNAFIACIIPASILGVQVLHLERTGRSPYRKTLESRA